MRIALLGAGRWATEFTAPSIAKVASLSGVWSRRRDRADVLARKFGVDVFETPTEAARSSDAVAIAVEPTAQPELAAIAAHYARPVLLEKPLAATLAEAAELAAILDAREIRSLVVMTYRFLPVARHLMKLRAAGESGDASVVFLTSAHRQEPLDSWRIRAGAVGDIGVHVLDLLGMAMGPIKSVAVQQIDGIAYGIATGPEGRLGRMIFSTTAPVQRRMTTVQISHAGGQHVFGPSSFARPADLGATVLNSFVQTVSGDEAEHLIDHRGALELQRLAAQASQ